jgi:hypothetical protein
MIVSIPATGSAPGCGVPDAGEQVVEQLVDQVGAAVDVRVERIGGDAEPAGDRAHRERVGALLGGQLPGGGQDGGPAEAGALSRGSHGRQLYVVQLNWTASNRG